MRSVKAAVVNLDSARRTAATGSTSLPELHSTVNAVDNATEAQPESPEAGFEAGYKEGLQAAQEQYTQQQQQLDNLLRAIQQPLQGLGDDVAKELVALSVDIARSLVQHDLQQNPEQLSAFVANAIAQLPAGSAPVVITLHPEDLALITAHSSHALNQYQIDWQEDPSAIRGSFKVTHDASVIQGGIDAMLENVLTQMNAP